MTQNADRLIPRFVLTVELSDLYLMATAIIRVLYIRKKLVSQNGAQLYKMMVLFLTSKFEQGVISVPAPLNCFFGEVSQFVTDEPSHNGMKREFRMQKPQKCDDSEMEKKTKKSAEYYFRIL